MIYIMPGKIVSLLTFPGIILHEFSHMLMCKIKKIPIYNVCYFKYDDEIQGYVVHKKAEKAMDNILISVGPFIINSIIGMLIGIPASILFVTNKQIDFSTIFLLWLSISITMHSLPSPSDAQKVWEIVNDEEISTLNFILLYPFALFMKIAGALAWTWFDFLYSFILIIITPNVFMEISRILNIFK